MANLQTTCCISGGGPAGMMLGFLLARAGIEVIVLEKHGDFLRDFRGDTIHPSTLQLMHELGLLDEFLSRAHQELGEIEGQIGDTRISLADFTHLPTQCKFLALMPQWDFLDFIASHARRLDGFSLMMNTQVTTLLRDEGRVIGVRAKTADGDIDIHADLVVGADGRRSTVRAQADLEVEDLGAPMDVLWMRVPRNADDPSEAFGHIEAGRMLVMIDRDAYWQCALVIAKGSFGEVRSRGIAALRDTLRQLSPWLGNRVDAIAGWDDVKLLSVSVDRLKRWSRAGLLCIGDAAHAMSPVGGVGINLAIQDAVAAANLLAEPLRQRTADERTLQRVQDRRQWPTRATQWMQVAIQKRVIGRVLSGQISHGGATLKPPALLQLFNRFPLLRRIPARLIGLGVRPEHVRTRAVGKAA